MATFGLFWKTSLLYKNCIGYFLGIFWKKMGYFLLQHLVTLDSSFAFINLFRILMVQWVVVVVFQENDANLFWKIFLASFVTVPASVSQSRDLARRGFWWIFPPEKISSTYALNASEIRLLSSLGAWLILSRSSLRNIQERLGEYIGCITSAWAKVGKVRLQYISLV